MPRVQSQYGCCLGKRFITGKENGGHNTTSTGPVALPPKITRIAAFAKFRSATFLIKEPARRQFNARARVGRGRYWLVRIPLYNNHPVYTEEAPVKQGLRHLDGR